VAPVLLSQALYMPFSLRRLAAAAAATALIVCLMEGTAFASAFSTTVTPFPTGGVYVPIVDEEVDPSNPLFLYDTLFITAIPLDESTTQYEYLGTLSFTTDPADAFGIAGGSMLLREDDVAGQFATCWSLGCSPDPENVFIFFDALLADFSPLFRADPDGGRASLGEMTVTAVAGGFEITSFFDLFIEIYNPDTGEYEDVEGSIRYVLFGDPVPETPEIPEPGTMLLLGSGLLLIGRRYRARIVRRLPASSASLTNSER